MYTTCKWLVGGIVTAAALLMFMPVLQGQAANVPGTVHIDSLSQLYRGVVFDHAMHVDLADGCAVCHHRGPGALAAGQKCDQCHPNADKEQPKACRACHPAAPFSAASLREQDLKAGQHRDVLGLKGAYHLACMGCHAQTGGPTGCRDCHQMTGSGKAFYHEDKNAPQARAAAEQSH